MATRAVPRMPVREAAGCLRATTAKPVGHRVVEVGGFAVLSHVAHPHIAEATMVEYAIMLGLIAIVSMVVITTIGADVRDTFRWVEHRI